MKYKATYVLKKANPFSNKLSDTDFTTKTVDVDDIPFDEIRKMAKEAAPRGYRFVKIEKA